MNPLSKQRQKGQGTGSHGCSLSSSLAQAVQILWLHGCVARKSPASKHTPHEASYSSRSIVDNDINIMF